MNARSLLAAGVLLCAVPHAYGQEATDKNAVTRAQIIAEMIQNGELAATRKSKVPIREPFQTTFGPNGNDSVIAYLIALNPDRAGYRALLDAMETHSDKQVGASPAGSGSTSLSSKGLVPEILGAAVESGALTEDVKGTVLTFRATPAGIVKALQGQDILDMYADYSSNPGLRLVSRFSAAASFDASHGSTTTTTFTGDARQLTNWSVRYIVINGRDPASKQYAQLWADLLNNKPYHDVVRAVDLALENWSEFKDWEKELTSQVKDTVDVPWAADGNTAAAAQRFRDVLLSMMPKLVQLKNPPDAVLKALDKYVVELTGVEKSVGSVYDTVNKGLLVTFDFSTARDASLPDLYTATGVIETGLGASRKTDLTVNIDASIYKNTPANAAQAFKSFNISAQLEHPLGSSFVLPSATAALSARYSYLPKDTVAASAGTTGTAASGSIFYVQGKVTMPVKGSGVKIPLSVTASNRTELINEANVRGSVGLTFDLDTFMTALGVKSK
jgi:hypothetical protein